MSNRPPQKLASRDVVVDRVAEGVTRLALRSDHGLAVNAYVLQRAGVVGLIDSGFSHTVPALVEGLAAIGLRVEDVDLFLPTHTHEDHVGGAVTIGERWSPRVVCPQDAVPVLARYAAHARAIEAWHLWCDRHLGSSATAAYVRAHRAPVRAEPAPEHWEILELEGVPWDARVEVGDSALVCVDGRGHDPVHGAWYDPERDWLFGGDVLLRVPTPILPPHRDQLATYRRTVERWRAFDDAWLLPGHGRPEETVGVARARARHFTRALYDGVASCAGSSVDPVELAFAMAGGHRNAAAATQAFVLIGAVWSQLTEFEDEGAATRPEHGTTWRVHRSVPSYQELL